MSFLPTTRSRTSSSSARRRVALGAAFALGLGSATASELMIGVWDDGGALLTTAGVTGTGLAGTDKATLLGNGMFRLDDVGVPAGNGLKTTIRVSDPVWGTTGFDLQFDDAATLRLDIVFTDQGQAEALSPDLLTGGPGGPGAGLGVANDLCENAEAIAVPSSVGGSTIGATFDDAPLCGTSNTAPGVWYSVVGTGTTMLASTCDPGTGYDSKLSVFCGSCDDPVCIAGNDDDCEEDGLLSTVEWCSQAGATYDILVHGFGEEVGDFTLSVSAGAAPCGNPLDCSPPASIGGCCFADLTCEMLPEDECEQAGGIYQGDGTACFDPGELISFKSMPNAPIPDDDPGGVSDTLSVPEDIPIADLDVVLTIDHTWTGDLIVTLTHEGTTATLVDRPGVPALGPLGCPEDDWVEIRLDDQGAAIMEEQCVPDLTSPPSYVPTESLNAAFGGMLASGDWTLTVSDNAGGDLGVLVSWELAIALPGNPLCQDECYLVIGDGAGDALYTNGFHVFQTQVGPAIEDAYAVLMESIPEFVLPIVAPSERGRRGATLASGMLGGNPGQQPTGPVSPDWMLDGAFAVQIMMWNPVVFPELPEQFSVGLMVTILPNGTVQSVPYGESLGGIDVWSELDVNAEGQPVIRFPFTLDMP